MNFLVTPATQLQSSCAPYPNRETRTRSNLSYLPMWQWQCVRPAQLQNSTGSIWQSM